MLYDISCYMILLFIGNNIGSFYSFGSMCLLPKGVHYLRNVADGEKLVAALDECKAAGGKVRSHMED